MRVAFDLMLGQLRRQSKWNSSAKFTICGKSVFFLSKTSSEVSVTSVSSAESSHKKLSNCLSCRVSKVPNSTVSYPFLKLSGEVLTSD